MITLFAKSTSSTVTVVSPTAPADATEFPTASSCEYAVALGQVDINRLFPHAPPVRAAKFPALFVPDA